MIQAKCIKKFYGKNGKIIGYRLLAQNGDTADVYSDKLKQAIRAGLINVVNITLTSDNRILVKEEANKPSEPRYYNGSTPRAKRTPEEILKAIYKEIMNCKIGRNAEEVKINIKDESIEGRSFYDYWYDEPNHGDYDIVDDSYYEILNFIDAMNAKYKIKLSFNVWDKGYGSFNLEHYD